VLGFRGFTVTELGDEEDEEDEVGEVDEPVDNVLPRTLLTLNW
jgi:hypothetical protein